MPIERVEKHIFIKKSLYKQYCWYSKNLYNYCNYILRQDFFKNKKLTISEFQLSTKLGRENQENFRSLPCHNSQQVIRLLFKNWKSYFRLIKDYYKYPDKYLGRPKIPKYKKKDGQNILIFTKGVFRLKKGYIYFPEKLNLDPIKTKVENIQQVHIIPQSNCYVVNVIYKKEIKENNLNENLYLGIDLGINNLATLISNQGETPLLLNGKIVKSINQYYNKKKSKLMSFVGGLGTSNKLKKLELKRQCLIENYFHHCSKFIVDYCLKNKIKNIVIGKNNYWKQNINIGKVNNQKFTYIPYNKLIKQISYKAEENNINIILNEESYTSKCDSLGLEKICKHTKYLGKRIKRGLFQSSIGKIINADVNGAINILRKVIGDDFIKNIVNKGLAFNPKRLNLLKGEVI